MKKFFLILFSVALLFGFVACSSDVNITNTTPVLTVYKSTSTTGSLSDFTKAFLEDQTIVTSFDKDEDAILISANDISSLTEERSAELFIAGLRGQAILIDSASSTSIASFLQKMKTTFSDMAKSYKEHNTNQKNILANVSFKSDTAKAFIHLITSTKGTTLSNKYQLVAIIGDDLYFIEQNNKSGFSKTSANIKPSITPQTKITEYEGSDPLDYNNETTKNTDTQVEHLVDWIKGGSFRVKSTSTDVSSLMSAQQFTHSFTTTEGATEEVLILVWPFYEFPDTNHQTYGQDYYVVQTELTCNNNELGYKNNWSSNKTVGPYFNNAIVQSTLGSTSAWTTDSITTTNISPVTTTGSTSFGSSVGLSLGTNVGINAAGVSGGFTAGITFSQSETRSIPDISITENNGSNNNGATWTYQGATVEGSWDGLSTKCDGAKSIQYNTAIFDTYLVYEAVPTDSARTLQTYTKVTTSTLSGKLSGFLNDTLTNNWENYWTEWTYNDVLSQPNRYNNVYTMKYEGSTDAGLTYLSQTFPTLWINGKIVYGVDEASTDSYVKNLFNEFVSNVEADSDLLTSSEYFTKGNSYTFTLTRENSSNAYKHASASAELVTITITL